MNIVGRTTWPAFDGVAVFLRGYALEGVRPVHHLVLNDTSLPWNHFLKIVFSADREKLY